MILWQVFLVFFRVSLFAIGGAYSFLPLMQKEIVERYGWLTGEEFLEVLGLVQVFPGAISIKFATYTGYKVAGVLGVIVANLANMLIPVFLIIALTYFYQTYKEIDSVKSAFIAVQLVVFAMIIAMAFRMVRIEDLITVKGLVLILCAFSLFLFTKIHPALIIILGAAAGFLLRI